MESLLRAYHDHGPIFRVAFPGREIVIIAGREANELLALHEEEYFRSRDAYATLAAESGSSRYLFATDGDDHNSLRRALRPAFSREALACPSQIVGEVQRTAHSGRRANPAGNGPFTAC
jgi:cytochrome P450